MALPVHSDALAAAQVGAGWAFERIYDALAGPVAGYLRSQGVADPDGDTHDVFIGVFKRLSQFEGGPDQLRSWVFTIAHNRIIDGRRFASRRPAERLVDICPETPTADCADAAMDALADDQLRRQLDLLSPDQRDVLLLRFVADLSLEEAAATTGRTVGAVKALQHRALASVRRSLSEILPEAVSRGTDHTLTEV
ncbi:MAG: RNA polymerase sigma factor [Acidimicrobiales bacterium]